MGFLLSYMSKVKIYDYRDSNYSLLFHLNELVSNGLCNELRSATVSQKLLFKNFIYLIGKLNWNLDINVLFRHHVTSYGLSQPQIL